MAQAERVWRHTGALGKEDEVGWADGMGQVEQKARGTGAGGTAVAKARIQRGAARKQDQEPGACPDAHTPLPPQQTGNKRTLRT